MVSHPVWEQPKIMITNLYTVALLRIFPLPTTTLVSQTVAYFMRCNLKTSVELENRIINNNKTNEWIEVKINTKCKTNVAVSQILALYADFIFRSQAIDRSYLAVNFWLCEEGRRPE